VVGLDLGVCLFLHLILLIRVCSVDWLRWWLNEALAKWVSKSDVQVEIIVFGIAVEVEAVNAGTVRVVPLTNVLHRRVPVIFDVPPIGNITLDEFTLVDMESLNSRSLCSTATPELRVLDGGINIHRNVNSVRNYFEETPTGETGV
jgi:hypothetical protein